MDGYYGIMDYAGLTSDSLTTSAFVEPIFCRLYIFKRIVYSERFMAPYAHARLSASN